MCPSHFIEHEKIGRKNDFEKALFWATTVALGTGPQRKIQQKALFGDHAGICKMMFWSSAEVQLLQTCCERSEIERALQVKFAALATDILGSLKKKASAGCQKLVCDTALGQEAANSLRVYSAHSTGGDFVPNSLARSIEIACYLLACTQVGVTCLRDALADMNAYRDNEDRTVCVIKEFFLGSGGDVLFKRLPVRSKFAEPR